MNNSKKSGISHFIHALHWSIAGFKRTLREEAAFRQELLLCAICVPAAVWIGETAIEMVLMIGSLFLILIAEFVNTAIEAAIDRAGEEWHSLSAKAKDAGSAAVMFSILNAFFVWVMIIVAHLKD